MTCEQCEHLLDLAEGENGIDQDYWDAMDRWHALGHKGEFWHPDGWPLL